MVDVLSCYISPAVTHTFLAAPPMLIVENVKSAVPISVLTFARKVIPYYSRKSQK